MNIRSLIPTAVLAAAGLALTTSIGHSQLAYSDGNLILGFQATSGTGSSTDYEVNLGSAANFFGAGLYATGAPVELNLGPIGTDLASTYGAAWYNNANLQWSIDGTQHLSGNGFTAHTSFATFAEGTVGVMALTPGNLNASQLNTLSAALNSQNAVQYAKGTTNNGSPAGTLSGGDQVVSSTPGVTALFQPTGIANSFSSFQAGTGSNTQSYSEIPGGNLNDFSGTNSGSVSDLFEVTTAGYSYMGAFQFSSGGNLYFDSATPAAGNYPLYSTPEPNSLLLLTLGGGLFLGLVRRRTVATA